MGVACLLGLKDLVDCQIFEWFAQMTVPAKRLRANPQSCCFEAMQIPVGSNCVLTRNCPRLDRDPFLAGLLTIASRYALVCAAIGNAGSQAFAEPS